MAKLYTLSKIGAFGGRKIDELKCFVHKMKIQPIQNDHKDSKKPEPGSPSDLCAWSLAKYALKPSITFVKLSIKWNFMYLRTPFFQAISQCLSYSYTNSLRS